MQSHTIVSREEWREARTAHLAKEKEFTRLRDQLSAERRALPWVKVDKTYVFEGPAGKTTLAELFDGRRQLIVYHFMFGPGWEEGCPSCFLPGRPHRRRRHAPRAPRRDAAGGVAGAPPPDRSVQEAHGLAVHVGVVARDRLQLRLSRVVHEGPDREGRRGLQLRPARIPERGSPRHQRLF